MNKMNTIKEDLENISIENNEEIDDVIISEIICYGEIMNYDASN